MEPSTPRLAASFRPETYAATDVPEARPAVELRRPVDIDRRPARPVDSEPQSTLSFADFLDVINPLQHIPIVGDVYRYLTRDQISGPARVVGGALFGGPIGFVAGVANAVVAEVQGSDLGEFALAALFGEDEPDMAVAAVTDAPAENVPAAQSAPEDRPLPTLAAYHTPVAPALTGAAALQALGADLRGAGGNAASALPTRPVPASSSSYAGIDARYLIPPPRSAFTTQVLAGLDKYKAMSAPRRQTLDESL